MTDAHLVCLVTILFFGSVFWFNQSAKIIRKTQHFLTRCDHDLTVFGEIKKMLFFCEIFEKNLIFWYVNMRLFTKKED